MAGRDSAARLAAELAARESYGRLLAYLASRWRDVAAAEDALSEAFATALERWPTDGVPRSPEGWLLTAARRKLTDGARHLAIRERPDVVAALQREEAPLPAAAADPASAPFPDERLRLMLVCAHPALDPAVRPALILQVVLGLEVKAMASAFVLSADTLTKRLVRAKAKLRDSGVRFEEPETGTLDERLHALLEALYAAYFLGGEAAVIAGDAGDELRREALYLGRLVAQALPERAEALGFCALLCFCEARRPAQVGPDDELVPLLEQDVTLWDRALIEEAYALLQRASLLRLPGPFQLEAAIAGAHCYRVRSGTVPWREIAALYDTLVAHYPTLGAAVGRAVAVAYADDAPHRGLALLQALGEQGIASYQPWWAAAAHLHERAGDLGEARRCLTRALGLTSHPRLQRFLRARLAQL